MSQKLDNKPDQHDIYDDGNPGWYKRGKDDLEDSFGAPSATDDSLPLDHPSRTKTPEELAEAESGASSSGLPGQSRASTQEASLVDKATGQLGKGFTKEKITKLRVRGFSRRQKIAGGVTGAIVTGGVGLMAITAPTLIVNHLREVLLGRISSLQVHHSRRYRRSKISTLKKGLSKEGRIGNSMIGEMERRYYKFSYDSKDNITELRTPKGQILRGDDIGLHIDDYMEKRHPFRTARWKTKRMNAFYNKFGVSRRSIVTRTNTRDGPTDPDRAINKAIAEEVVDDSGDLKTERNGDNPDETDEDKTTHQNENADNQKIDDAASEIGKEYDEIGDQLVKDGTPIKEIDNALVGSIDEVGDGIGENVLHAAEQAAKSGSLGGKAFGAVKSFVNPTDIMDRVCTLRNRLRMAQTAARGVRAVKLMRYASVFIGAADASRTGKVDSKLMNSLMKRVMANDSNGNPISASPGFAYALKGKFSKSRNDTTKSKVAVDGKLGGVYQGIKNGTDSVPGMSKCWLFQNPGFQIVTGVGDLIVKGLGCVFTGCSAGAAEAGGEEALKRGAMTVIREAITNAIERAFTKAALKRAAIGLAKTAALELSFEGAMTLVQLYAEKTMRLSFTGQEQGGELGDILVAGTGTLNKQRSLAAGMVPATTTEYASAQREYVDWLDKDTANKSVAERIFDMENEKSLAFQSFSQLLTINGSSFATAVNGFVGSGAGLFNGSVFSSISRAFTGSAYAADSDEVETEQYTLEAGTASGTTLVTDFSGNVQVILRDDIANIDPESNADALITSGDIDADTLEPKSPSFKNHITNCVDAVDILSKIEFENNTNSPDNDCLARNSLTKKFKAHLAYLDMMDGFEAEFLAGEI